MSKIPKLRFKEFSGEWGSYKLGNLSEIRSASRVHKDEWTESGVPFFRSSDVVAAYKGLVNNKAFISMELFEELSKKSGRLKKNDLLVTGGGSIGIPYLVKNDEPLYSKDADLLWIKNTGSIDGYFLYTFFSTAIFRKYVENISHIGTISHYTIEQAKSTPFNLPIMKEQQKIASFLSAFDIKIDQLTRKKELLVQYKKGAVQKIFSQELRFKADDGNEFSEWEEKMLGNVCTIKKGTQLNKDDLDDSGEYAVINGGITPSGYNDEWNTEGDTITISEGGNSCGFVNFMNDKFWSGGHCYTLDNVKSFVINDFLYQYLKAFQIQLMRLRVGSGLPNIQKGDMTKFKISIPSKVEQIKIANFFSTIDTKIDLVAKQLDEAKNFKKGLLQQMFV